LELFVPAPRRPITRRKVVLAVLALIAGTAVAVFRTRGPGALNSIWAEDGQNFLHDALTKSPIDAITTPFNGYWHLLPRLLAEIAVLVPLEIAPAVLSILAALVTTSLALLVYTISGAYFEHTVFRLAVAVPVAFAPAGIGWVENNVATLQFPLLYGLFWALLWVPATRTGRAIALVVVAVAGLTSPLALVFTPLLIARLIIRPSGLGWGVAAALSTGIAVQFGGQALGYASRAGLGEPRYTDPVWAVYEYMTRVVPVGVLGEKWSFDDSIERLCPEFVVYHHNEHRLLVLASWAMVAVVVYAAVRFARPAWALAIVAGGFSVALWSTSIMALGCSAHRYLTAPALLLIAALAALMRPKPGAKPLHTATVVFLTFMAVVLVVNLRTDGPRAKGPKWSDALQDARSQCADPSRETAKVYTRWAVVLPCDAVRR
jgi:hypothetical protein